MWSPETSATGWTQCEVTGSRDDTARTNVKGVDGALARSEVSMHGRPAAPVCGAADVGCAPRREGAAACEHSHFRDSARQAHTGHTRVQ